MSTAGTDVGRPLANYAAYRRAGNLVMFSGVIAVDGATGRVVRGYDDLPPEARVEAGQTGEVSVDAKEGPINAQTWAILHNLRTQIESLGGSLADVVRLVQYFRDLRDFPAFSRVRKRFFPESPPASTIVEVARMLPTDEVVVEIEATAYLPEPRP